MTLTPPQRQTLLWAAVAVLLGWGLVALGSVLTPFVAAAILAYMLEPGVRWLRRHRVPRVVAVSIVLLVATAVMVAIALIVVPIVQYEVDQLRERGPAMISVVSDRLLPWLRSTLGLDLRFDAQAIRTWFKAQLATSGEDWLSSALGFARTGWTAVVQVLGLTLLVPVALFYFLLDWDKLVVRVHELVPPRWHSGSFDLLSEVDGLLGQYFRGQVLVMLALAAYYSVCLLVAGFELWLPIGVLTGLLVAIPYLGFALGMVFALVSGMLQFGVLHGVIAVAIIYGAGQVIESVFLTPRLVGERIGLHPLAVIFALLAFAALLGFVGVLLALPLSALAAIALRRLRAAYLASEFFRR